MNTQNYQLLVIARIDTASKSRQKRYLMDLEVPSQTELSYDQQNESAVNVKTKKKIEIKYHFCFGTDNIFSRNVLPVIPH